MKKLISVLLVVCIVVSFAVPVMATDNTTPTISTETVGVIQTGLRNASYEKDNYGLDGIDFSSLYLGNPIKTYEYTANGYAPLSIPYYPLFSSGDLVAFALISEVDGNPKATISTAYVDDLSELDEAFALVFDRTSCYLLTENSFDLLLNFSENEGIVESRASIDQSVVPALTLGSLSSIMALGAMPETRSEAYMSCAVDYVSTSGYSNISWAACVACIGNYLVPSMNETAVSIAQDYLGNSFNSEVTLDEAMCLLWDYYGITYTNHTSTPTEADFARNIGYDRPVYTTFSSDLNCVVYGVDVLEGSISIMSPVHGFETGYRNAAGSYSFTNATTATTVFLLFSEYLAAY